jgi:hypothetical protein
MTCITYVVVFGLDGNGRPHAACFAEHDAALAIKAARYLGYRSVQIADAGLAEVLPRGNVFASRNAFVRRISRVTFEKLLAAADHASRRAASVGR